MTMQGIAQIMAGTDKITPERSTKASDSTFESFMSKQAVQVSGKTDQTAGVPEAVTDRKDLAVNRYSRENSVNVSDGSKNQQVKDTSTGQPADDWEISMEEAAEFVAQTMVMLQEMFGLSLIELQDIMNQLSLEPQDLFFAVEGETFSPVNISAVQSLLLGIHGIDDAAAFLTNDDLTQEFNTVMQRLTGMIADQLGVSTEELADVEPAVWESMIKAGAGSAEIKENATVTLPEENGVLQIPVEEEAISVVLETQENAGSGDGKGAGQTLTGGKQMDTDVAASQASAVNTFTENLVRAFEDVRGTEDVSPESMMRQIVEQVVRQVRIRVMPETTRMDIQLNPASLGRVNLTVATTAGVATASMVVENQMAKEALESQMIQLRETFAEQGLKVDAVEVTVAEFGLKKENEQQDDPAGGRKQNRRSHAGEEESDKEEETDHVTASRRDMNSVVDYTA